MLRLQRMFKHLFNPLHVFCRLRDVGVGRQKALSLSQAYERLLVRTHLL